ncbi:MAG: helix-turn-helix transcriptional regulator [Pseudomonadota bacterium]
MREARKLAGLTQRDLAERLSDAGLHCASTQVSAWERGESQPRAALYREILRICAEVATRAAARLNRKGR